MTCQSLTSRPDLHSIQKTFEQKIAYEPNCGCWLWEAGAFSNGYGAFHLDRKVVGAHRFSYRLYVGSIPDGMLVCHSCDIPQCVNPDHLWLGSHADNTADMMAKGRGALGLIRERVGSQTGEKHPRVKLTENEVLAIIDDGRLQADIANEYGITQSHVSRLKNGNRWVHLLDDVQHPRCAS